MGRIIGGALMPHPPLIIPVVGGDNCKRVSETISSMQEVSRIIAGKNPSTVIVISPHGFDYDGRPSIIAFPDIKGSMSAFGAPGCLLHFDINLNLTECIWKKSRENSIDIYKLGNDMVMKFPQIKDMELDSGAFVPLYYLHEAGFSGNIVHICPGRMPLEKARDFGKVIADAVKECDEDVVIIGSGDLSHYLKDFPPYGYRPEGPEFDEKIINIIEENDLNKIFEIDAYLIERAGECGLRSLVMLMASADDSPSHFYSYEDSFGVGYAVALWEKPEEDYNMRKGKSLPVRLAEWTLHNCLDGDDKKSRLPVWADVLSTPAGVFVSLKKNGELRGCIGTFMPQHGTLKDEIFHNAISAALCDPRFFPVTNDELAEIVVSVDVLSVPEKITYLSELDAKKYGVIVVSGERRGLLLPDLEGVGTVDEQLRIAMQKAGIMTGEQIEVFRFTVMRYV